MSSSMQEPGDGMSGPVDPAPRPTRRTFTAEYKARIVSEYESAPHGEKSAVLRREGLFDSHVREWTATRDAGVVAGLDRAGSTSGRRQRRADQAEIDRLRAENQRLTGKLAQTQVLTVTDLADDGVVEDADRFSLVLRQRDGLAGRVTVVGRA